MSGAPTVVPEPPRPARVGSYELLEAYLTSGPSTFYRARNLILGNPVIVRRLTLDPARADDARETFFREMRHAASLDHRAISRPTDVLEQDGYVWSVHPPRVTAPSNVRVETSGPLSVTDAARAGADVADALAHLHSRGFVYGRVSPRWISLDEQGASLFAFTKSADLAAGIWPLREPVAALSAFTAPEELRGGKPNADGDLYGLAATLLWWLSKRYPAGGADPADAMRRAREGAGRESLRAARPDVPEVLASAVDGALEPDPASRRGSVAGLATLLDEIHHRERAETPAGFSAGAVLRPSRCPDGIVIEGRHGSGAFGVVFRARAECIDAPLAVKALKPVHREDADARERFLREARALEAIEHENVVRMHAVGEEQGTPYAVMDFVAGPDLATVILREGALPARRALRLGIGIARGLAAIHREGIVHRDLKPHNVLVAPGDRPVIADFGLAKSHRAARMTMTGILVGTPAYMAPELIDGGPATFAVDLFSFGAMLFEMLAGQAPFAGDGHLEVFRSIRERPTPALPDALPEDLRRIVARLLAKDPTRRPAGAAAVAGELEGIACRVDPTCGAESVLRVP